MTAAPASAPYKVVLVFQLEAGEADEELRRSARPDSFPRRLAAQPGFLGMELIKLSPDRTMSIQTWRSEADFHTALHAVKSAAASAPDAGARNILVSREFFGGCLVASFGATA